MQTKNVIKAKITVLLKQDETLTKKKKVKINLANMERRLYKKISKADLLVKSRKS